jgi:branched-chain amino acid transport system substrate-binding protein
VRLDHHRQAIGTVFITEVQRRPDGSLYNKLVKAIPNVNQTLGIPEDEFLHIGSFNRDIPPLCP